jgi:DNA-binding transcriptional regulator LsrR (DeoR family)
MEKENSLLIQFLGDNPMTRIVDFLIENKSFDYSKEEIAEGSGVSRTALFKYWERIEKFGLVKITRTYGKTKLYTLNTECEVVKELLKLEFVLIKQSMDDAAAERAEIMPVAA